MPCAVCGQLVLEVADDAVMPDGLIRAAQAHHETDSHLFLVGLKKTYREATFTSD